MQVKILEDKKAVAKALVGAGWFVEPGAYYLVDGQFGSSGKGLLAAVLARFGLGKIDMFTANAGPNSGHTALIGEHKIMTQQLPVGVAVHSHYGAITTAYMNAGAIIVPDLLKSEINQYFCPHVIVHPCAAVVLPRHVEAETSNGAARVAGTGKGTGAALADKVNREGNLAKRHLSGIRVDNVNLSELRNSVIMVEASQGFSLGINEARFAPHTTSRECTVLQAASDARLPMGMRRNVAMALRTWPIRVGSTPLGSSGDFYPDQVETSWEELGVTPELTTVTKRVRRVFTWSDIQFEEALLVNEPDTLFLNFLNYLKDDQQGEFVARVITKYKEVLGKEPLVVLGGFGPDIDDVRACEWG